MKVDKIRIFLLPKTSDNEAAGKLINMPGMVEAAAITPVKSAGVPKLIAKGLSTGSLDMVELKMAKAPMMHKIKKYLSVTFLIFANCMSNQLINIWAGGILLFSLNALLLTQT
jgi:hypothetical protein